MKTAADARLNLELLIQRTVRASLLKPSSAAPRTIPQRGGEVLHTSAALADYLPQSLAITIDHEECQNCGHTSRRIIGILRMDVNGHGARQSKQLALQDIAAIELSLPLEWIEQRSRTAFCCDCITSTASAWEARRQKQLELFPELPLMKALLL